MSERTAVADRLVDLLERLFGMQPPICLVGWDGSEAGSSSGPRVHIKSRKAVRRLLWQPGELGLARAYVAGEIDIEGDLGEALADLVSYADVIGRSPSLSAADRREILRTAVMLGAVGPQPKAPPEEVSLSGERHSIARDRAAVSHHYDVGNVFYERMLGPSMVYSCGYWADEDTDLEGAQQAKLDLVCRKLDLQPGQRLLDVGCGWGSLLLHAATHYDVTGVGVTLSTEQAEYARKRADAAGLSDRVEIRLADYREIDDGPFDAIASVGMAEHVGQERFGEYAGDLLALLRPGGRLLNHQITQRPGAQSTGPTFIGSYVFPDGELLQIGTIVSSLENAGLEVRDVESLREHYPLTLRAWSRNLERHWQECMSLAGEGRARVWRLYLAVSGLAFTIGRISIHQVLCVRRHNDGRSGMPRTREALYANRPVAVAG